MFVKKQMNQKDLRMMRMNLGQPKEYLVYKQKQEEQEKKLEYLKPYEIQISKQIREAES